MDTVLQSIIHMFNFFARAGGGGSGSGGGGGGGIAIIGLVGYVPMHYLGRAIRKRTIQSDRWQAWQIIGWTISAAFFILIGSLAIATRSSSAEFYFLAFIVGIGGVLGMGAGLYSWFSVLKQTRKTSLDLKKSGSIDPTWNEQVILDTTKKIFMSYQRDWSNREFNAMRAYMTARYWQHASLMVVILRQSKRINRVNNPHIQHMLIVDSNDSIDNSQDCVTVGITAVANDELFDEISGKVLFKDDKPFTELWKMKRIGDGWFLDGIEQSTASMPMERQSLRQFAADHEYYYSTDMGWLFIPRRGGLFSRATFGSSDINNHIVGVYNQAYLLQLYSYYSLAAFQPGYIIAQTNLPKSYGRIIVKKKRLLSIGAYGLRKVSMEWGDFNKKYQVYASDKELVTSFELLHPAFMEKLAAQSFEINIEVVDNIVYLYTPLRKETKNLALQYEIMLEILMEAYKQMKM